MASNKKIYKCRLEGHDFEGEPERFVIGYDKYTNEEEFDKQTFCHIACVNMFLRSNQTDPILIIWYQHYLMSKRGFKGDFPIAPDPGCLKCYNVDGVGLTIEEFRDTKNSYKYSLNPIYPQINRQIFSMETQQDNKLPFSVIHEENYKHHRRLYSQNVEAGKEIPKAIQDDMRNETKLKEDDKMPEEAHEAELRDETELRDEAELREEEALREGIVPEVVPNEDDIVQGGEEDEVQEEEEEEVIHEDEQGQEEEGVSYFEDDEDV